MPRKMRTGIVFSTVVLAGVRAAQNYNKHDTSRLSRNARRYDAKASRSTAARDLAAATARGRRGLHQKKNETESSDGTSADKKLK